MRAEATSDPSSHAHHSTSPHHPPHLTPPTSPHLTPVQALYALTALYRASDSSKWELSDTPGTTTGARKYWMKSDPCSGNNAPWYGVTCSTADQIVELTIDFGDPSVTPHNGQLPSEVGGLTSITDLTLRDGVLTGPVPSELGRLSKLASTLDLHANALGTVHDISSLPYTAPYDWERCSEECGSLPTELGQLTGVTRLNAHSNDLTSQIPTQLGMLTALDEGLVLWGMR